MTTIPDLMLHALSIGAQEADCLRHVFERIAAGIRSGDAGELAVSLQLAERIGQEMAAQVERVQRPVVGRMAALRMGG